jgi:hypothetical protein
MNPSNLGIRRRSNPPHTLFDPLHAFGSAYTELAERFWFQSETKERGVCWPSKVKIIALSIVTLTAEPDLLAIGKLLGESFVQ